MSAAPVEQTVVSPAAVAADRAGTEEPAMPTGEVLRLLVEAHRRLAVWACEHEGVAAAGVAALESSIHLVRAVDRMKERGARPGASLTDALGEVSEALAAARASVVAATFAMSATADAHRRRRAAS